MQMHYNCHFFAFIFEKFVARTSQRRASENILLLGNSVNKGLGGRRPTQVRRRLGPQVL
jgi:hypothetical protein